MLKEKNQIFIPRVCCKNFRVFKKYWISVNLKQQDVIFYSPLYCEDDLPSSQVLLTSYSSPPRFPDSESPSLSLHWYEDVRGESRYEWSFSCNKSILFCDPSSQLLKQIYQKAIPIIPIILHVNLELLEIRRYRGVVN